MAVRHRHKRDIGKKAVYITQHRNLAVEVMRMYEHKGYGVELKKEKESGGETVYVVYVYLGD